MKIVRALVVLLVLVGCSGEHRVVLPTEVDPPPPTVHAPYPYCSVLTTFLGTDDAAAHDLIVQMMINIGGSERVAGDVLYWRWSMVSTPQPQPVRVEEWISPASTPCAPPEGFTYAHTY